MYRYATFFYFLILHSNCFIFVACIRIFYRYTKYNGGGREAYVAALYDLSSLKRRQMGRGNLFLAPRGTDSLLNEKKNKRNDRERSIVFFAII
jgi:hypothetical protein